MSWHKHIHEAIQELHPGASLATDYVWVDYGKGPKMTSWDEEKLGPLDLQAIEDRATAILTRPAAIPVPKSISKAQGMMALYNAGLLDDVETVISSHDYRPVRIWFDNANEWNRDNPYIQALGQELGMSAGFMDELFRSAALLS